MYFTNRNRNWFFFGSTDHLFLSCSLHLNQKDKVAGKSFFKYL